MRERGNLQVLDPVGDIAEPEDGKPRRLLEDLTGKRVGLLWGKHAASIEFWPVLERTLEEIYVPSEIHRAEKPSTWNPADPATIEELAKKIDYAVIGVGA